MGWVGRALAEGPSEVPADAGVASEPPPTTLPALQPPPSAAAPEQLPPPPEPEPPAAPPRLSVEPTYGAVGLAPPPGARISLDKLPSNVQRLSARELVSQHALSVSDALNARLGSVTINDVQSNPLQPDLQYRGFTASPLIGTPQGISIYQNGVRLNEPFGDVMQWDLVPLFAIADATIVPGANPQYGMNTLGGSLVLRMKDGFSAPGYRIEGSAGSFSRYRTTLEYGHAGDDWAAYAGASLFGEQGFRDKSSTTAQNLYADLRKRGSDYELGVGITLGSTSLNGNGPAPIELLRQSRSALFTWPDNTKNQLVMIAVDGDKKLANKLSLESTLYVRHGVRNTSNGDATDFGGCAGPNGMPVMCTEDGVPLKSRTGMPIDAADPYTAVYNTTQTDTNGFGGALQLSAREKLFDHDNQFLVGVSYDGSQTDFAQNAEFGRLTIDRGVEGGGPTIAGPGLATDLFVATHMLGVYAVDNWNVSDDFAIHVAGRFNFYSTALADRLGDDLDGHHTFARVNPSVGITERILPELTLFASYAENNRAPSAAELACADPDQPCRLPNAFISDPPLQQVVSRSVEIGLRTHLGPRHRPLLRASLAAFGSRNQDDILFVAGSHVGTGYFQNAGTTQRIGVEAAASGELGPIGFYASYTLLRATFESELSLPRNAAGGDDDGEGGTQDVEKGARIPGLPTHALKAGITWHVFDPLAIELSMLGQSSQPFRGDEANLSPFVHGYVILNAQATYRLLPELSLFVRAQNLLDTKYDTFGVLANPAEVLPGTSDPRFLGVGAPFGLWAGMVLTDL
jgi:outer membrane receptor protein involved in Fe transport